MMKATSPIDGNIALLTIQTSSSLHTATSADAAKLEKAIENRTIVTDVVLALLSHVAVHVVGCDLLQKINVVIGMKLCHFASSSRFRTL